MPFPRESQGATIPFGFLPNVGSTYTFNVASGGSVSSVSLNGLYHFVPSSNMFIATGSGALGTDVPISPLEYPPRTYFVNNSPVSAYMATSSGQLHCIPLITP